jgi:hypothetical protein
MKGDDDGLLIVGMRMRLNQIRVVSINIRSIMKKESRSESAVRIAVIATDGIEYVRNGTLTRIEC